MSIWKHPQTDPTPPSKQTSLDQDDSLIESVLSDFTKEFGAPKEQSSTPPSTTSNQNEVQADTHTEETPKKGLFLQPSHESQESPIDIAQKRLERIESRIKQLDETKPEYVEERVALEKKRSLITQEHADPTVAIIQTKTRDAETPPSEKELQRKAVEDLLNKKMFSYIAPIPSPEKEEEVRLKKATEAAEIEGHTTTKNQDIDTLTKHTHSKINSSPDARYTKAAQIRSAFIGTLSQTPKVDWYKNPSKNRDFVNQQVLILSELLSGKKTTDIDMNDIQTARLFLFNDAPEDIMEHPAFSYVESFYDYQNNQGFSGKDVSGIKIETPHTLTSPFMSAQPKKIEEGAVQSPISVTGTQKTTRVASPFINLNNTKKRGGDDVEFSI
jgi:hypothetical protein